MTDPVKNKKVAQCYSLNYISWRIFLKPRIWVMFGGLAKECYKLVGDGLKIHKSSLVAERRSLKPPNLVSQKLNSLQETTLYKCHESKQLFLILSVCLESLETRKVSLNNGTTSIVDRDAGHTDKLFIQLKSLNNSIALLLFCPTPTSKPILPLLWRSCYGKTFILILFGVKKKPVCESTKSLQKTNFDFVWTSCVYI